MNEQLQQALTTLIQQSLSVFEKGAGFLSEEIPQVIQQLLLWHAVHSFITFVIGVLLLLGLIGSIPAQVRWWKTEVKTSYRGNSTRAVEYAPLFMLYLALIPILFGIFQLINLTWLKIWIAPKLYILEYGLSLVKG